MTKAEFLDQLSGDERLGSKKAASDAVDAVLDARTGARIPIPGGKVPRFSAGSALKTKVMGGGADAFEGGPARCSQALEAGELRLDRDAGRAGLADQVAAVLGDRGGSQLGGRRLGIARLRPLPGQLGRVGVEAEADLAATLFDERRKPIGKASQRISRP